MKNLKLNTDDESIFEFKDDDEPYENILIYGNRINCFGHFFEDGRLDLMSMEIKDMTLWLWLPTQIIKYNANVYIICNEKNIGYYQNLLKRLAADFKKADISKVKLLKECDKVDILEQFGEL